MAFKKTAKHTVINYSIRWYQILWFSSNCMSVRVCICIYRLYRICMLLSWSWVIFQNICSPVNLIYAYRKFVLIHEGKSVCVCVCVCGPPLKILNRKKDKERNKHTYATILLYNVHVDWLGKMERKIVCVWFIADRHFKKTCFQVV